MNKPTRKLRKRFNKFVRILAKLYEVTYRTAMHYYNKANRVVESAKVLLNLHTQSRKFKSQIIPNHVQYL